MKNLIIILLLLGSVWANGQKKYQIGQMVWIYTKPPGYVYRVDNFADAMQKGDSVIRRNNAATGSSKSDKTIVSVAKNKSKDINIVLANYQNNTNIKNLTLKGYVDELMKLMQSNYEKLGSAVSLTKKALMIGGIQFYVIENKIYHKEKNYTYWTGMYIAEISNQEFNIAVAYDNEQDKKQIEKSVLLSAFTGR